MTYRLLAALLATLLVYTLPAQADTVRWGRSGDAATLDPHAAADGMTLQLVRNIYEPLVEREPDGRVTGKLAASWLRDADDPKVWVFNLRRAVFHDGSAFNADDVVFSFNRARGDGSALDDKAAGVVSVRAINPLAVEIRFAEETVQPPAFVSDILVMDKEWAEANEVAAARAPGVGDEAFSERNANGTGPYKLDSRDPDVRTKLVANARYHSAPPAAGEIIHLPIINPAMQATALLWGEIDVLQDVAAADIERLEEADAISLATGPANSVLYLGYRFGAVAGEGAAGDAANPFDNSKVREAIDLTLDRHGAAALIDRGHAQPTVILAPSFVDGWSKGLSVPLSANIERAKEMLAGTEFADGFAVTLDTANGNAEVAEQIAASLSQIGIEVEVETRPAPAHEALVASGESALFLNDFAAPDYDSASILEWLVSGHEGYENQALAERVEALAGIRSRSERNAAVAALWLDMQEERIVLPIAQRMIAHAMRDAISVTVDPNNQTRFEAIRFSD